MATTVDGLASGIKYNDIIAAMVAADRSSTAVMEKRKATFQGRFDALRSMNTKMLSHQLDLNVLNKPSLFNARVATSSNTAALPVTTTSAAKAGTYSFDVVQTAKAHQLAALGQSSSSSAMGVGTLNIQLGTGATTPITIAGASSSLDDIASAINGANIGVSAAVISDGSATPFRLMLTAKDTGTANSITVTGTGSLSTLFTGATDIQTARNAKIMLGSGVSAIPFEQSSNTFTNIVPGVTLTAQQDNVTGIQIAVANSAAGAKDAVKTFITSYNDLAQFLIDNASLDTNSGKSGVLFSDSSVRSSFNTVTQSLLQSVPNQPQSMSTLTGLGISIDQATGKLSLDESVFDAKIAADPTGVGKIFSNSGVSSDPGLTFLSLTSKTKTSSPFTIGITQAASKASVTGTTALSAGLTTITSANKDLSVTVNGTKYTVAMTPGDYSASALASHLQSVFNQKITSQGDKLTIGLTGSNLTMTSANFGSTSTITVDGSGASTANTVFGMPSNINYGTDVQGTINGTVVKGNGQILSGIEGTSSEGLKVQVTASASIASATITATKGIAQTAGEKVAALTDNVTGTLVNKQDSLQKTIDSITKSITATDARLAIRRTRYEKQFQTMEQLISKANNQGAYFTSQVKGFENGAAAAAKG